MSLHLQSGFVVGAIGGGDDRGSEVDYCKTKHQLRRPDTSPLGTREVIEKKKKAKASLSPHSAGSSFHSTQRMAKSAVVKVKLTSA